MNRSLVSLVAACLAVLGAAAQAQTQSESGDRPDSGSTFSDAGANIKKGATDIGHGIKQGAETVGEKVKSTAIGIWEAGKAAVDAGSRKLHETNSPPPAKE